ncbi:MAG: PAS domain S-box protein [Verrucomicrobiota bacterium]
MLSSFSSRLIETSQTAEDLARIVGELQGQVTQLEAEVRQLRETQQRLEASRNRYAELYDLAPVGYLDLDSKGLIQQINQTGANFLGRPAAELIGKRFLSFVVTKDIHKFVQHVRQCLQSGARRSTELRLRVKGNESFAVQLWSAPVHDRERRIPLCRTTLTDITERKMAEEALHESKECFRIMTDTAPVLVWMTGTDGQCTYFNRAWMEYTGRTLKQELGLGWTEMLHPDDLQRCLDYFHSAFEAREKFNFEFRLRRSDKQYRWFLNTGIPRFTPQGAFAGYIGSCIDITERKQAEEMRRQVLEDLEVLVQERTANLKAANHKLREEISLRKRLEKQIVEIADREQRRIGNDLHDGLGQQLTGVAFLSKVLEQRLSAKAAAETSQASEIHKLVNNALSHTRELARGLHVVELETNGLVSALQDLRTQIENLYQVKCQLRVDKLLRIHNAAVATHLYRITQEAVNNAIKHGKAKNILISLASADRKISLSIKDDGLGIPEDFQERKGMGLHTMRYRTEMIRGVFEIRRPPDGGTVVSCTFPTKANSKSN